jgi:ribosome maturation factor RimP
VAVSEDVSAAVGPAVAATGCTLYDVEVAGSGPQRTVRVLVDRDGGVDLDTVTAVTHSISPVLEGVDSLAGPYLLEVSSPGIERPLRRPEHYRAARGETVTIKFHTATGPQRVRGTLVDVTGAGNERCVVDVDGEQVEIPLADVTQARTVFEWGPQPRPGKLRARAKESRHA